MFLEKIDTTSPNMKKMGRSPAGYDVYYDNTMDVTVLETLRHQRIYFMRIISGDHMPHKFAKCQHFGSERYRDGDIEILVAYDVLEALEETK